MLLKPLITTLLALPLFMVVHAQEEKNTQLSLYIWKVILDDSFSYEGIGLPPDVVIKNTLDEINGGIDRTLDYAIEELK